VVTVPNIVSNTSKTSRLRPLVWYVYSYWLALRVLIKFGNKKLVCTTHHTIPLLRNQTITIHDIRPFYYPDSLIQKVYFRFLLKMSVKRCKHVLTVSYTVKDSIAKTYNVDSEKISVIYNSVSKSDFIQKKEKENYFLAVGASWPHKNIHSFIKNKKVWSDSYNLIIVCGRTDYAMSLQQMVVDLKLTDKFSSLSIIVLQTDYIVMSQKLSAADIIKYTVTMKIFGLMFFIYTAVLQALWPVCAELRVKMQWRKLHRIIFLNIIGGVFFIGLGTLFIYVLKDYIYSIIANGIDYNISEVVFVLLAVYFSIRVWCDTFAMLLQSMNQLKILWLIVPCQALIG
ncbi:glycosyltransferase, partial [Salmonella enterica]